MLDNRLYNKVQILLKSFYLGAKLGIPDYSDFYIFDPAFILIVELF